MPVDWTLPAQLTKRVEYYSEDLIFTVYNRALKYYGRTPEVKAEILGFGWNTMRDHIVCPICRGREGRVWKAAQMMPHLPAHIGCRCSWAVVFR
jgi:SPP1 gp7 family putative phage head morphogenesis protein